MAKDEKIILFDSDEAASIQTVTGWVGADGVFWGDNEHQARFGGSTHKVCEKCGTVHKTRGWCKVCHAAKQREKFAAMPVVEWDGETPLALFNDDTYFFDEDAVHDYAYEHEIPVSDLPLVLCRPHHPREFDVNDLFSDYLAEDCEVEDSAIINAVEALNKAFKEAKPMSWMPGNSRVILGVADVPTNGVAEIKTRGENDTWPEVK